MPAQGRPLKSRWFQVEQEQEQLQGVGQPDLRQVGRRRESDPGVAGVEGAAEAPVG